MKMSECYQTLKRKLVKPEELKAFQPHGDPREHLDWYLCILASNYLPIRCAQKVHRELQSLLGDSPSLEFWLQNHHGIRIPRYWFNREDTVAKYLATRHAWLDHLIAHHRSLGN